jgi:hypothetical protein
VGDLTSRTDGDIWLLEIESRLYGSSRERSRRRCQSVVKTLYWVRDNGYLLGKTLEKAFRYDHWNIVKWLLINTRVDVSKADYITGDNILHRVIISYNADKSRLLNERLGMTELCLLVYVCDEDVNVQGHYNGNTPLHKACNDDNSDRVGVLLLAGADETILNDMGQTPVQLVAVERYQVNEAKTREREINVPFLLLLVRSHRLRRRTAVRVMMALVKWKVQQRKKWAKVLYSMSLTTS